MFIFAFFGVMVENEKMKIWKRIIKGIFFGAMLATPFISAIIVIIMGVIIAISPIMFFAEWLEK